MAKRYSTGIFSHSPTTKSSKSAKSCYVCEDSFNLLTNIRHRWQVKNSRFCQNSVCSRCSPQKAFHPTEGPSVRICNQCYSETIGNRVTEDFESQRNQVISQYNDVRLRLMDEREERKRQELEFQTLKREVFQFEQQQISLEHDLEQRVKGHQQENLEVLNRNSELKKLITKLMGDKEVNYQKIEALDHQITQLQNYDDNFPGKVEELKSRIEEQVKAYEDLQEEILRKQQFKQELLSDRPKRTQEYQSQIRELQQKIKILDIQNAEYTSRLQEMEDEINLKESSIALYTQQAERVSSHNASVLTSGGTDDGESDYTRKLKDEIAEQMREMARLYNEIKKAKANRQKPSRNPDRSRAFSRQQPCSLNILKWDR